METRPAVGVSRQEWHDIVHRLSRERDPTVEQLALLAQAHWWLCDIPEATRLEELLHERHLTDGQPVDAADAGLRVSLMWGTRGNVALAKAWLERACRVLDDQPRCRVHGYADYLRSMVELDLDEDHTGAAAAAERLQQLGREERDHQPTRAPKGPTRKPPK